MPPDAGYEGVVTWDQEVDEFEANWDERQATVWPKPRELRRKVVEQVDMLTRYGNDIETLLSCGHVLQVKRYSRYHGAKTMGCYQCSKAT